MRRWFKGMRLAPLVIAGCLDFSSLQQPYPEDAGGHHVDGGDAGMDGGDGGDERCGSTPYPRAVLEDNPVAYWRLEESAPPVAHDCTNNGHDGTYFGNVTLGAVSALVNDPNTSLSPGLTGHLNVGDDDKFGFAGGVPYSLEAWIFPGGSDGAIVNKCELSSDHQIVGGYQLFFYANPPSIQWAEFPDLGPNRNAAVLSAYVGTAIWTHLVVTFDTASVVLYVNGIAIDHQEGLAPIRRAAGPLVIGRNPCANANGFTGSIDELAIYDHALLPNRILAHYHLGRGENP